MELHDSKSISRNLIFGCGVPCVRGKGVAIGVMELHQYVSHNHKSLSRMVTPRRPDCDRKVGFATVGTFYHCMN